MAFLLFDMGDHGRKEKKNNISKTLRSRRLDSVVLEHLLAEVVLVLADAAVPSSDGLVLADHNILGDLVEKSEIVRHDDDTTGEGVDGIGERVNGRNIETVGRLVQQDHVGRLDGQQSKDDSALLALGKSAHKGSLGVTAQTVLAQLLSPVLVVLRNLRELVATEVQGGLGQDKLLSGVLRVDTELQV